MPVCSKCGGQIAEGDRFCLSCGAPVSGPIDPPGTEEDMVRKKAEKRVKERMELLQHIGMYFVVNAFLVVVWALSGAGYPWFIWVMAGWGLGLVIHIITYFIGARSDVVKDRMVQKEMEKMKSS